MDLRLVSLLSDDLPLSFPLERARERNPRRRGGVSSGREGIVRPGEESYPFSQTRSEGGLKGVEAASAAGRKKGEQGCV